MEDIRKIPWEAGDLNGLIGELMNVRKELIHGESEARAFLRRVHPTQRKSALNLIHYLALRRIDLRALQPRLTARGLSSLGRSEAHVLVTVDALLSLLHALAGKPWPSTREPKPIDFEEGRALLKKHTLELLGPETAGRGVRIMVTMPSEAAEGPSLVRELLNEGMNCMRINGAHDEPEAWQKMVRHLRTAQRQTGRPCRVLFDLGGPKLRTGPLAPGPRVLKVRPKRNVLGEVVAPARIWLTPAEGMKPPPKAGEAVLPLPEAWLGQLRVDDVIRFKDARKSSRKIKITSVHGASRQAECRKTAYLRTGTEFVPAGTAGSRFGGLNRARIGELPAREEPIVLHMGETLLLTRKGEIGQGAIRDEEGKIIHPAHICCTAPDALEHVKRGENIWFDDGKIGAVVESFSKKQIKVRITQARVTGERLRADKGINLPDSVLTLNSLTAQDVANLPKVARYVDLIGYSFVRTARDVEKLQSQLQRLGRSRLGIILKIETRAAFERLPELLLAAMRNEHVGVMIARGDLAVECGYNRLAEVQEEILWLCEAAHIPVIWATQVLEKLSRSGSPTRAEVTDAAMAARAECVMLNKGPKVVAAVRSLDNILRRMEAHLKKKRSMLRALSIARNFNPAQVSARRPGKRFSKVGSQYRFRSRRVHPMRSFFSRRRMRLNERQHRTSNERGGDSLSPRT